VNEPPNVLEVVASTGVNVAGVLSDMILRKCAWKFRDTGNPGRRLGVVVLISRTL